MNANKKNSFQKRPVGYLLLVVLLIFIFAGVVSSRAAQSPQDDAPIYLPVVFTDREPTEPGADVRTVNATFFNSTIVPRAMGLFWLGKVTPLENYADVRVGYNASDLVVDLRIIDQQIWYDRESPSPGELTDWDAVTLFFSTAASPGTALTAAEYKIVAQLNNSQAREDYQAIYQGDNGSWHIVDRPVITEAQGYWQQDGGPNDNGEEDYGWRVKYTIPFSALDYSSPPHDANWRIAVLLHDRDDAAGTAIADKPWPETFVPQQPETWGRLHFGQSVFTPPGGDSDGVTTIKHGVAGAVVQDAHVGGAFDCGEGIDHWTQWGNMNYESIDPTKINIQNQTLVGDWPCFSKYFIAFPLDAVPAGRKIIAASLTMNHFGNSGGGEFDPPQHSWIQVFSVVDAWADTTLTWNNAPLAFENISMTRVEPLDEYPGWPGIPIPFDVSEAADAAYRSGESLNLALYSSDSEMHSGKYFFSSDSNSDGSARPILTIYWQNP